MKKNNLLPTEVKKKLARLNAFTMLNPRPIIEVDFKGSILDMNENAKKLFPDLKRKGIRHGYLRGFGAIVKSLKTKREFGRDIKIGEKWYKQRFYRVPQFELIHIYGSDATARKRAEETLRASEQRYRSLFNKISEGHALYEFILDKKGRPVDYKFLDINPAYEHFANIKYANVIGKTIKEVFPKTADELIKKYAPVVLTGRPLHQENYHRDIDKHYEVFAYKTDNLQFAVLFFDITQRKRIEEEKDNFISIMSHELRNPLTPILSSSQLLLNELTAQEDQYLREYVQIIERHAKSMSKLLNDLLDTSRMSRKQMQLDKKMVDVKAAVGHAVESVRPIITQHQQALVISLPRHPVFIEADPVRLEQIIVNLLTNAAKYTHRGGRVEISLTVNNGWAQITVKDNGIGIEPEKIKQIFKLFNTSHDLPFVAMGSLGIGMNITKHLMAMHGGKIQVTSKGKNKGSTFTVKFPEHIQKHADHDAVETLVQRTGSNKRVLIVDDNKDIAYLLSRILGQAGYSTQVFHNGSKAVKAARTFKPQACLIDIGMPGMNGYEVAKKIGAQQGGKQPAQLIAVTGYGQDNGRYPFLRHLVRS